jgi:uncharacterized membrane protein
LFFHTIGMAFVAGLSGLIDLRILGVADEMPIGDMRKFLPYMWAGFIVNAVTGLVLFALDATTKSISPVFYTKMAFIAIALVICVMQRKLFTDPHANKRPVDLNTRLLAVVSIACWIGAITAGRLLAYIGPGVVSQG